MAKLFDAMRKLLDSKRQPRPRGQRPQRRDSDSVGRSSNKEIEEAPPERVGELVGHAVERVET